MGSDAEVFIFDHDAYLREVIPAFRELLLTGQSPEWLLPIVNRREIQHTCAQPTDLLKHCTYLGKDLSWIGCYDERDIFESGWDERACKSEECPERDHCPLHRNHVSDVPEELLWLFMKAVSARCLGASQFVGRSMLVTNYLSVLESWGVQLTDPLAKLLWRLGKRGFVIGYRWGFGYEGINGWLDPLETAELAQRLSRLPLPEYERTFEAMRSFRKPHPIPEIYERFGGVVYICPGVSFEELSLSFVRTMAALAADQLKGILWGNDVV